ncbi:MAG: glycosyltransferase family 2 protein [Actinomycetota bacterium]
MTDGAAVPPPAERAERTPPVASIVVTNYNYERFLADAVTSAVEQTIPCQVVVVDDGSTDGSAAVLDRLAQSFPELVIIRNRNGGQAAAMNAGWSVATGPIVLFLDADDRLVPTAVARIADRFDGDADVTRCLFRLQWIDADGREIDGSFPAAGQPLPTGDLRQRVLRNPDDIPWQPTSGNAFRRSALARFMPIPEPPYRISADHYLSNLSALTGVVAAIEAPLGHYRVHGENADHRQGFDLTRARSILVRTVETRFQLIAHGAALGLETPSEPDSFVSLTNSAMRLASLRGRAAQGGGGGHPIAGDNRWSLIRAGVQAAVSRDDLPPHRRVMAASWIMALGIAPTAVVPRLAALGLTR